MLRVTISTQNISASLLELNGTKAGILGDLPEKLSLRAIAELDKFCKTNSSVLHGSPLVIQYFLIEPLVLYNSSGYHIIPRADDMPLVETIGLIHWYLDKHIYPKTPRCLQGDLICNDCHSIQMEDLNNKCCNPACTSHEKWQLVDSEYVKPDVMARAFMGIPRDCNTNTSAQKG